MRASFLDVELVESSKVGKFVSQAQSYDDLSVPNVLHQIWLVLFQYLVIVLYRIDLFENSGQRVIPKLVSLIEIARGEPEIADVVSVLYLSKGILAGLAVSQLLVNGIVFVDDVLDEVLALLHVLGLLAELPQYLFIVLSKLFRVLFLVLLCEDLLARISRYLVFDAVALVVLVL